MTRVDPASLDQLLHPTIDPDAPSATCIATGLPASPGAATRQDRVHRRGGRAARPQAGEAVILVRDRNQPGRHPRHGRGAQGILTARGGMTSHAAVVARGMGRPASPAPASCRSTTAGR